MERQYLAVGLRILLGMGVIASGLIALVTSGYSLLGLVAAGAMMFCGLSIIGGGK